jgi:hypothetical protein
MSRAVHVEVGDQVFAGKSTEPFGAVRQVRHHELIVDVEGFGDAAIPGSAVEAVHEHKVIVELAALSLDLRRAIRRAHDQER